MKKNKDPNNTRSHDLFSGPPVPAGLTLQEILQLAAEISQASSGIPEVRLNRKQRGKLDGYLFSGHRLVAFEVARALQEDRELFPDVPTDPGAAGGGFKRASAWLALAGAARLLAERAETNYLMEEGGATWHSLQVIYQVRAEASHPFPLHPPDRLARRAQALRTAEDTLARVRGGRGGGTRGGRGKTKAPTKKS